MKNNSLIVGVLVVAVVAIGLMAFNNGDQANAAKGNVYFGVTDDTADIESVNEITLEIDEVHMRSNTNGWVKVTSDDKDFDLLDLKANNKTELYAVAKANVDSYDQVKIVLGDVVVDSKVDGQVNATVPNNEITFDLNTNVQSDVDSSIVLDFLADQSLHVTTGGEFVFTPVVEVAANSHADVQVNSDKAMVVRASSANNVESRTSVGVDLDGLTKTNYRLDSSAGLELINNNRGNMTFKLGDRTITTDTNVNSSLNASSSTDNNTNVNVGDNVELRNDTDTDANLDVNSNLNSQTSGSSNSGSSSTSSSSDVDADASGGTNTNVNVGL